MARYNGPMADGFLPLFPDDDHEVEAADAVVAEPKGPRVFSVSELTSGIKDSLESQFAAIWVSGEVSEVSRPQSGHIYFNLKDESSQIRAVLWRSAAQRLPFTLEDGQQVILQGNLDVYLQRGTYQIVVRTVEPQGLGALQIAFRQMQQRLAAEGLFDPRHKKPLPSFPQRVAFVTSPTGAAVRDFLEVATRRFRGVNILVIPARVQGEGSATEVARGIELANRLKCPPDVLVVGRGGGSLEDLWAFNTEQVVRAIFASKIPVVSAVGHEIDVTLADLVADVRALTPSEAAERLFPSSDELRHRLGVLGRRLATGLRGRVVRMRAAIESLAKRRVLQRPHEVLYDRSRRLDELDLRMQRATQQRLTKLKDRLTGDAARLESLSPLAVLARGYSVTQLAGSGKIVRSASQVQPGDLVQTQLHEGHFVSRVEKENAR
jgi:exodeoxyribonuclease VII large subunit